MGDRVLLLAHLVECMKIAGMKIQIHKNSRHGTMDVHCVPVSMLAPKKECLEGQGWIDDPKNCVDCDTVLKDSFPNAETGECECRINQVPSEDGKRCEIEQDDTPTDMPPACLAGNEWYSIEVRQDDAWCNINCCASGCTVQSGCCSYENGVSDRWDDKGVAEVCWD